MGSVLGSYGQSSAGSELCILPFPKLRISAELHTMYPKQFYTLLELFYLENQQLIANKCNKNLEEGYLLEEIGDCFPLVNYVPIGNRLTQGKKKYFSTNQPLSIITVVFVLGLK